MRVLQSKCTGRVRGLGGAGRAILLLFTIDGAFGGGRYARSIVIYNRWRDFSSPVRRLAGAGRDILLYFTIYGARVVQSDHLKGNYLHDTLRLRRLKCISERQLPASYAAITSSKINSKRQLLARYAAITPSEMTSERQLSERYAAFTSSKATASAGPGARLHCILKYMARVVQSDHLKDNYLRAMLRLGRQK